MEEQLLSQRVDLISGDSELSVVSDSGSLTHASPASLQALTTTTAQLRQQVRNLQTELASLKQVIANNSNFQLTAPRSPIMEHCAGPVEQEARTKMQAALEEPIVARSLEWLQSGQMDLQRMLQDIAKDVQRNTITLDQSFLAADAFWA